MHLYKVLVVDDNRIFLSSVRTALNNFVVLTADTVETAFDILADTADIDIVLLDLVFDESQPLELQGLVLLTYIKEKFADLPTIIMTNLTSTDIAVKAIKSGAVDFLNKKELDWTEWKVRLEYYCKNSSRIKELEKRNDYLTNTYDPSEIIGVSEQIEYIRRRLKDLAQNSRDVSLLITGETGTGKNLAVKYFKKNSQRNGNKFIEFSILELTETLLESELFGHVKGAFTGADKDKTGLFEEANNGILFLDEIGDYDIKIQKKIMRFLEERVITPVGSTQTKRIETQLILATNRNLLKLIEEGKFREDLYHRINRIVIHLPPLRERREDILYLTNYYFNYFREKEKTPLIAILPKVYDLLCAYSWPGNVRELQSVIWDGCTRARLWNAKQLQPEHIREDIRNLKTNIKKPPDSKRSVVEKIAAVQLEEIETALKSAGYRKGAAADLLELHLDTLRYTILKYYKKSPGIFVQFPIISKIYKLR